MATIVAVAGAGIEQGVAAEQGGLVGMRQNADMAHRMPRRVEAFELDGLADLDDIAGAQSATHLRDAVLGIDVGEHRRLGRGDHLLIATGVVAVLVGIEDLRDGPAFGLGRSQTFLVVERVDRERLAGFGAGDQIIEITTGIRRPDLFDDHDTSVTARRTFFRVKAPPRLRSVWRHALISAVR